MSPHYQTITGKGPEWAGLNLAQFTLLGAIRLYRAIISPILTFVFAPLGFGCRFRPTCSEYAADAVRTHGACKGTSLALRRLCRCHPWGGSGYDPVPDSGGAGGTSAGGTSYTSPHNPPWSGSRVKDSCNSSLQCGTHPSEL